MTGCLPFMYRISTTEPGLAMDTFYNWQIAIPDIVDFRLSTTVSTRGDASQRFDGFRQLHLTWTKISELHWYRIKQIILDVNAAGSPLYMTIDPEIGDSPGQQGYIDLMGYPHQPQLFQPGNPSLPYRHGRPSKANLTVFLNDVTILNDPSLYSIPF